MQAGRLIGNVALFQAGWFACVLGAASGLEWAGPLAAAIIIPVHLMLMTRRAEEVRLIIQAAAVGIVVDTLLFATGAIRYQGWGPESLLPPPWLPSLWMIFATTLNASLAWMKGRWTIAALLGAAGGAGSYSIGARLGAIRMDGESPILDLILLAVAWGAALPLLLRLAGPRGEA